MWDVMQGTGGFRKHGAARKGTGKKKPCSRVLRGKTFFTFISHVEAETISCLSIVISQRSSRRGPLLTSITRLGVDNG
jgi:hypothetical protein